jgi:hypothetical protein
VKVLAYRDSFNAWTGVSDRVVAALMLAAVVVVSGCSAKELPPPQAIVSPMITYMRPAKPPDCPMPVLHTMPSVSHREIALLDAWGQEATGNAALVRIIRRKACGVGADAVVITSDHSQEQGPMLLGWGPGPHTQVGGEASGANISAREHPPAVGEVGHGGHYMSAIAIVYDTRGGTQRADSRASQ